MTCDEALAAVVLGAPREAEAHAAGCRSCALELARARRLGAGLAQYEPAVAAPDQAARTLAAARPLLARRKAAARVRRQRLVRALALSLLPLPAILLLDTQLIRAVHALVSPVFPPVVSTYLVGSLGALLALLLALAYGTVPLLAGRLGPAASGRPPALDPPTVPDRPDPEEAHA